MTRMCVLLLLGWFAVVQASAAPPVDVRLDAANIATLPRIHAAGEVHGVRMACEGVALADVLRAAGAMPDQPLRGQHLAHVVVVTARDGYRVAFGLAELDPTLGARRVVVADRCNGAPIPDADGPWRLVVPDDARPARWVRQIDTIRVVDAP